MKYPLPKDNKEFFSLVKQDTANRWDKIHISVLVFGPDVNSNKPNGSSLLRKHIMHKCKEFGILVRAEHEGFDQAFVEKLGPTRNLCQMENVAALHADALVIIPDSPGSFIELGMFSQTKKICSKTLILFHELYEDPKRQLSFVFQGSRKAYKSGKASISFIDYKSKDSAWDIVYEFLHDIRARKWDDSVMRDLL